MDKPLVLLDVDGVLNVSCDLHSAKQLGLTLHYFEYLAGEGGAMSLVPAEEAVAEEAFRRARRRRDPRGGGATGSSYLRLAFDPRLPHLLEQLQEVATIKWCTLWEGAANRYISPLVGLPQDLAHVAFLPEDFASSDPRYHLKTKRVAAEHPGEVFLWLDDEAYRADRRYLEAATQGRGTSRFVAPGRGLTQAHVEAAHRHFEKLGLA